MTSSAVWIVLAIAADGGCSNRDDSKPEATRPQPPAPPDAHAPKQATEPTPSVTEVRETLMRDHFDVVSQARDAVLRGQLERAEAPLIWLGQHGFSKQAPPAWQTHLERMQQAARDAVSEHTLAGAAKAVGHVASECGACHAELRQGPRFEPTDWTENDTTEPARKLAARRVQARMQQQTWGMERMWEGLVGPWDVAWQQGAASLVELSAHPKLPAKLVPQLERVRLLGKTARDAQGQTARAAAYGELLATCAGCHASLGVDPGRADIQTE